MRTRLEAARSVARDVARAIVAADGRGNGCVLERAGDGWPEEGGSLVALGLQTAPKGLSFWQGEPGVPPVGAFRPLTSAEILSFACGLNLGTTEAIEGLRVELAAKAPAPSSSAPKTGRRCRLCGEPGHYAKTCGRTAAPAQEPVVEEPVPEEPAEKGTTRWVVGDAP